MYQTTSVTEPLHDVDDRLARLDLHDLLDVIAADDGRIIDEFFPCPSCQPPSTTSRILHGPRARLDGYVWSCNGCNAAGTVLGLRRFVGEHPELLRRLMDVTTP